MRYLLAALAAACLAVCGSALAGAFPDGPGGPNIAIVNQSSLSDKTLAADLPAFQLYADQVCEAWHCNAHLYLGQPADPRDWPVVVNDVSIESGAIGFHLETAGVPGAFVSVLTAKQAGLAWTVVFTHELAEMLVDPSASTAAQTDTQMQNATFYMFEVCDPVQGESYRLGRVKVSDFVYRSWFQPDAPGPYDAGRHLTAPLTLAPNSYLSFYAGGQWQQRDTFGPFLPHALRKQLEIR